MSHKILVMLLYYERPQLVRHSLESILLADERYNNWHLAFHDDGSQTPGEPIVREMFSKDLLNKVTFYRTFANEQQKQASGGMLGFVMNQMIRDSDADIGIILCDDDALHPAYLKNLNNYYEQHPACLATYCHVVIFNPETDKWREAANTDHPLNHYTAPINPSGKLDAAQVSWKLSVNKTHNAWFPYPCRKNHDAHFYHQLYEKVGEVPYMGFIGQYKAIHPTQLAQQDQPDDPKEVIRRAEHAARNLFNDRYFEECERLCRQLLKADPDNKSVKLMLDLCPGQSMKT